MSAPDKYDKAIAYLTEHPDEIADAWGEGTSDRDCNDPEPGSCLFNIVDLGGCGSCLTQVRRDRETARSHHPMIEAIRADHRIPADHLDITVDHLELFAEWQRKIDAMDLEASS